MTLQADLSGQCLRRGGEGDARYLVILSAASWASAPRGSSIFRLSCSVNHEFNIYLTIQYLPRRFAARVTEEIVLRILSKTRYTRHLKGGGWRRWGVVVSQLHQWDTNARYTGTEPLPHLEICVCTVFFIHLSQYKHLSTCILGEWLLFKV